MNPLRGVRWSALLAAAWVTLARLPAAAGPLFEDPGPLLEGPLDPLARSPRVLGMGRLGYVLNDVHNRINLWDLGGNPVGVIDADSSSTLELGPTTGAASAVSEPLGPGSGYERQTLGARDVRTFGEAWRRVPGGPTYGAVGDWSTARSDQPYNESTERRSQLSSPNITGILGGILPVVRTQRIRYALRMLIATASNSDRYRLFVRNAAGEFLDQDGAVIDPPDFFQPVDVQNRTLGIGAHFGVRVIPALEMAAGYDFVDHRLVGTNDGFRHAAELREERPYHVGQFTMIGRLAGHLELGADVKGWLSKSHQTWVFTTSAGTATEPLAGRGKVLDREEKGSSLDARARWTSGSIELGAGFRNAYQKVDIKPPGADDASSLNHFLDVVFNRTGADTLALPDSVARNTLAGRSWEAGAGAAWTNPWTHGALGLEARYFHGRRDQDLSGAGPRHVGWDVRAGLEHPVLVPLRLRAGYVYRWEDLDKFTALNEYVTQSATAGLGFRPAATRWSVDVAYAYEWIRADFDTPTDPRLSRQQLAARLRWLF